ncbi:hypothetical protein EJB05_20920, partial [Eragrostis curvula]
MEAFLRRCFYLLEEDKARQTVVEIEKAVLSDDNIHKRDLAEVGIKNCSYNHMLHVDFEHAFMVRSPNF